MILKGKKSQYQLVCGLEVHAQINVLGKLFSNAKNNWNTEPNSSIDFFDIAIPGILPILNTDVIEPVIKFGIAIDAKINKISHFDRKHYFYPDLPNGYQISQFFHPIIEHGKIKIKTNEKEVNIRINRVHIEQDAGKLIHDKFNGYSAIDFNRAGIPLMEIVSEPDFKTIEEVNLYLEKLQQILRLTDASLADLDKGTFRCDVNLSLMDLSKNEFGTRCEIKNLNSFKNISKAIEFEARRQFDILESGNLIDQETRLFNANTGETKTLRTKVDAIDYRYFPDPDLKPIILTEDYIQNIKFKMPESIYDKENRYQNLNLSEKEINMLCSNPTYYKYFDSLIQYHNPKLASTWMLTELIGKLNALNISFENSPINSEKLIELMNLISSSKINGKIAKNVLDKMISTGKNAELIVQEENLTQTEDFSLIDSIIENVIKNHQTQVIEYKNGNKKLLGFFVGNVIKESQGKANPAIVNKILLQKLEN